MTIYGWDASHYDAVPNGARVVAEGFDFMTHKAGGDAPDTELAAWWSALKPYREQLLLGAYWVLRPDLASSASGAADAFLARLDSQCPGWRDAPFILQLDCEDWTGDGSTKPGKADIKAACDRLRAKMPKLKPIVYASAGQYGDSLTGLGYPLWNARYVLSYQTGTASSLYAGCGGDSGKGWNSYSGQTPAIWQFTSSATIAGQTTCDANAYRGTLAELTALLAPGWEDDMTVQDVVDGNTQYDKATASDANNPTWVGNNTGRAVWDNQFIPNPISGGKTSAYKLFGDVASQVMQIKQVVADLAGKDFTDEAAIIQGVLAGLAGTDGAAETIADAVMSALPPDLAKDVVDEMAKRLAPAQP